MRITRRTTPRHRTPAPTTQATPPLAAALAKLTEPGRDGLPEFFEAAYTAAPDLLAQLVAGNADARFALVERISGLDDARAAAGPALAAPDYSWMAAQYAESNPDHAAGMKRAIAVLDQDHVDLLAALTTPIADASFYVGFALAAYLLTDGGRR